MIPRGSTASRLDVLPCSWMMPCLSIDNCSCIVTRGAVSCERLRTLPSSSCCCSSYNSSSKHSMDDNKDDDNDDDSNAVVDNIMYVLSTHLSMYVCILHHNTTTPTPTFTQPPSHNITSHYIPCSSVPNKAAFFIVVMRMSPVEATIDDALNRLPPRSRTLSVREMPGREPILPSPS